MIPLVLALCMIAAMVATTTAAETPSLTFQLLSFACVEIDPSRPAKLEFEREVFPPGSDTGLFITGAQDLLYVERGRLMISSDQIGNTLVASGFFFLAEPGSVLGVRNDDVEEGSVLWLRFSQPEAVPAASAPVPDIRAWMAPGVLVQQGLQPRFVQFEIEPVSSDDVIRVAPAALFIARMTFAPFAGIDPIEQIGRPPATSGTIAFVVESGELTVNDGVARGEKLGPGEFQVVAGDRLYSVGTGSGPGAEAIAAGIVAADDGGEVGDAIRNSREKGEPCEGSAS